MTRIARQRRVLLAIISIAAIATGFYALSHSILREVVASWSCHELDSTSVHEIDLLAHVVLPADTADAHLYAPGKCTSPRPIYLTFTLKSDELAAFLRSTRIDALRNDMPAPDTFSNVSEAAGWDVNTTQSALYGSSRAALDYQQHILIETSNTKRYRIYLVTESYD